MSERDHTAYPAALEAAEAALVSERRKTVSSHRFKNGSPASLPPDAIGFGLSGGGIRSATFCLGVFQAMANARLLGKIDFVSTVSGGGYFGSFLGRLFTRDWVTGVDDVQDVLRARDPEKIASEQRGWTARTFRWLRDNGRYLAPRGSGDLIILGAILLRNWVAVQTVMITTVLTLFLGLQLLRAPLDSLLVATGTKHLVSALVTCTFPGANALLLWSPWIVAFAPLFFLTIPAGWAYWLIVRRESDGTIGASPVIGIVLGAAIGAAGMLRYQPAAPAWIAAALPDIGAASFSPVPGHPTRFWLCALLTLNTVLTLIYRTLAERRIRDAQELSAIEVGNFLRNRLTRILKNGLLACGAVIAWTLIDTVGGTAYTLANTGDLARWGASLAAVFAGLGAFARPALVLLAPARGQKRPSVPVSILSWIAAVVMVSLWLIAVNVASHAIAWEFGPVQDAPAGLATRSPLKILGADRIQVTAAESGFVVLPADTPAAPCPIPDVPRKATPFAIAVFGILAIFTGLFGRTRTFANMSSLHAFYSSRLTRTFLGASNPNRLRRDTAVKDTVGDDDCGGEQYWQWPEVRDRLPEAGQVKKPWTKGGPLHIVNTTVNETMDTKMKMQNQDRKGTGLALGPCGLSLGIRHHLTHSESGEVVSYPHGTQAYRVFRTAEEGGRTPDPLSLGRWISVSGAAFSAAAGANTTVPIAILAGMFNIRLGYWWDSGTPAIERWWKFWSKQWSPWIAFEWVLPVQAALASEILARTRGTAGELWNLSDGGHFENMGGYELIRRQLPVIVIVDAEADPDYTFQGLSDLVRKARLDFDAEVRFMTASQIAGPPTPLLPDSLLPYFGDLDSLRRGRWVDEKVPAPDGAPLNRYRLDVDRSRVSRAHAALAVISYRNGQKSWLVYVKATLTGTEPEDVCHYHRAHPDFPQETTSDQFFDEAQWESYRRLGVHVGHRVLTPELFTWLEQSPPQ
jgi:hypothetical protein